MIETEGLKWTVRRDESVRSKRLKLGGHLSNRMVQKTSGLQISPHPMTDDYARGKNEDDSVTLEWTDRPTTTTGFT